VLLRVVNNKEKEARLVELSKIAGELVGKIREELAKY